MMTWKTFDFNTGTELNRSFLDRIRLFLEIKESQIAQDCLRTLEIGVKKGEVSPFSPMNLSKMKFSEGVNEFSTKIHDVVSRHAKGVEKVCWRDIAAELNKVLWSHVEFLEGAIDELFFEVRRIDLQIWSKEIFEVVLEIKQILSVALNTMESGVNGLNASLVELRDEIDPQKWSIKRIFHSTILDEELITSIRSSRIALLNGFEKFTKVYDNLDSMKEEIVASVVRIGTMPVFSTLEAETQQNFLDLYELLKCYEKNRKHNLIDEKDILMSLRKSMGKEQAFALFRDYYHALLNELFHQSIEIKKKPAELSSNKTVEFLKDLNEEVRLLGGTIDHYREFLLSTDPNPYVRARLGFTEWVLGPESKETKHLYKFGYNLESLDQLYGLLTESVEKGAQNSAKDLVESQDHIEKILHEIGAPLLSEKIMENRAEKLIALLEKVNELGSFEASVIPKMGNWLGKAMRCDWRHHQLQRYPEFHEVCAVHMGLVGAVDDQLHVSRLNKFKRVLRELREWIAQREVSKHIRDIDLDINDVKGYLQEFLAHVQRTLSSEGEKSVDIQKAVDSFSQQLLEYRYLFGYFFHQLNEENTEEHLIRSKCYFVDQYFEAVDKRLGEVVPSNQGA